MKFPRCCRRHGHFPRQEVKQQNPAKDEPPFKNLDCSVRFTLSQLPLKRLGPHLQSPFILDTTSLSWGLVASELSSSATVFN
eukprot:6471637-Amphidinium_carterae.3